MANGAQYYQEQRKGGGNHVSILEIDGVPMPTPHKYRILRSDVDGANTTRNEAGFLLRERLRDGVYKLEVVWRVKMPDLIILTTALNPPKFSAKFFDSTTGTIVTRDMYAGDAASDLLSYIDENNLDDSFWELSRNLVEY